LRVPAPRPSVCTEPNPRPCATKPYVGPYITRVHARRWAQGRPPSHSRRCADVSTHPDALCSCEHSSGRATSREATGERRRPSEAASPAAVHTHAQRAPAPSALTFDAKDRRHLDGLPLLFAPLLSFLFLRDSQFANESRLFGRDSCTAHGATRSAAGLQAPQNADPPRGDRTAASHLTSVAVGASPRYASGWFARVLLLSRCCRGA